MKRNAPPVAPSRSIISLPEEVLSEIFINAVYNISDNYVMDVAIHRIASIYQRLHTLLAVCRTWRRVGLGCPTLWTVVPFADSQTGRQRPLSARLSLERGGRNNLHLAMSAWRFSARRFNALTGHWHRFSVINIWSNDEDSEDIHKVLPEILKHCPPGSISALSLRRQSGLIDMFSCHYPLKKYDPSISRLISSLAVFRTNNFNINWSRITFTHRLIDLELTNMTLYDNSDIEAFLAALSSAKELKELKLVFFIVDFGGTGVTMTRPPSIVSLPKLELLHLEHLHFNILQFILAAIAPGSYCLTLNPLEETFVDYVAGLHGGDPVSEDNVCTYLGTIKVQKLILWGQRRFFWSSKAGLTRLLKLLPSVETLVMNYYPTNLDTLGALKRPPGRKPNKGDGFPVLKRLEMHGAFVEIPLADLKPVLKDILESHQIQRMIFGGVFVLDQRAPITEPLDMNHEVFEWLKGQLPQFKKSPEPERAPEATDMWRLWDI
ncbi:unnamed protein product [Rhizoctonia solani]|uniref:F-box domain-containing protein n=1 Tax=Rhizoctonia solani TaxID=456999 RepID=A0A8H3DKM7_9AGAM|nr:unnamed protein product [Rhizoctonia solani]CAE6525443.1 unnamed protein product [Rhizoctonia solani]